MIESAARIMPKADNAGMLLGSNREPFDLVDLILVFIQHRKLFLSVMLTCILASVAFVVLAPETYEARAAIFLGQAPDPIKALIPTANHVTHHLEEQYDIPNRFGRDKKKPYLYAAFERGDFLVLSARGRKQEEVLGFLQGILDDLRLDMEKRVKPARETLIRMHEATQKYLKEAQVLLAEWNTNVPKRPIGTDSAEALGILERAKTLERILAAENTLKTVQLELLTLDRGSFSVAQDPKLLIFGRPIRPRPFLYCGIGVLLGFVAGLAAIGCYLILVKIKARAASA